MTNQKFNFSVYHQVYNNKEWTIQSLTSLINLYPNVHIRLVCDGGIDHSDLMEKFKVEYIHDTFNVGIYDRLNPKVISGQHIYGWTKEEAFVFLKRIYDFAKKCNTEYILFSEDDIIYNKKFNINEEDFDLTGRKPGNFFPDIFVSYIKNNFPNSNLEQWGSCAGNFLNTNSFIYCYENTIEFLDKNYDHIISNLFYELGWNDVLFNVLYGCHGMKYINNYDYSEVYNNVPIFHDKISSRVRNN